MDEHILVIEDDETLASLMRLQLERAGYTVSVRRDGTSGLDAAQQIKPDLILLDVLLPEMSGWDVCKRIQEDMDIPIIFTTALGAEHDMVHGLNLGADDYIAKPFGNKELITRVKSTLHRAHRPPPQKTIYEHDPLYVDLDTNIVKVNGQRVYLTPLEYKLLSTLIQEAGDVMEHETLLRRVWGPGYEDRRQYLKLYIWYLRQKIETDPSHPQLIFTERGVGYRLAAPAE